MKLFRNARVIISVLLVLMMVLTACGGNNVSDDTSISSQLSTSNATAADSSAVATDPFGKYDHEIDITVGRQTNSSYKFVKGESFDKNIWTDEYKNKLGINVKHEFVVDETQYEAKVNVNIASGDIPDLMLITAKQAKMLQEADLIYDMTDIFEQYGSDMSKRAVKDNPKVYQAALMDGKLMGIPMIWAIDFQYNNIWVRNDWMKKLNLAEPKTTDDLYKIAEAFTTQDPDANGKNDTFGIALDKGLIPTNLGAVTGWMNMVGAYKEIWMKDTSGNLVYSSIQPEMKAALQKLAELYSKGIIDREFGVKDGGKIAQDVASEKVGIEIGAFWNPGWPFTDLKKKNADSEWTPYPLLSNNSNPALTQINVGIDQFYVVNKKCKNPEAIVKMFNLSLENMYGSNIDAWNKVALSDKYKDLPTYKYPVISIEPPTYNRDMFDEIQEYIETKDESKVKLATGDLTAGKKYLETKDADSYSSWKIRWDKNGGMAVIKKQIVDDNAKYNEFFGIPGPVSVEKNATLSKLEDEAFTKIIMNTVSIDEFDKFVEQWKKVGGDDLSKEVNEWYAANK